jgi:hypothetical protein
LNILASRGPTEQGVCLDTLISLMLDSPSNQMVWFTFLPKYIFQSLVYAAFDFFYQIKMSIQVLSVGPPF